MYVATAIGDPARPSAYRALESLRCPQIRIPTVNAEVHLPSDEREAASQLADGVHDPIHQRLLKVAFRSPVAQVEELQHVRVFRDLLRQIRIRVSP